MQNIRLSYEEARKRKERYLRHRVAILNQTQSRKSTTLPTTMNHISSHLNPSTSVVASRVSSSITVGRPHGCKYHAGLPVLGCSPWDSTGNAASGGVSEWAVRSSSGRRSCRNNGVRTISSSVRGAPSTRIQRSIYPSESSYLRESCTVK